MIVLGLAVLGGMALCALLARSYMRRAEAAAAGAESFAASAALDARRAKVQADRASGFRETRRGLR